jgi:hypothetical protein
LSISAKCKARIINTLTNIPEVHGLVRCSAGTTDFCLTRAEGGVFLAFAKPNKRTTVFEDNTTSQTPEFEEREESSVGHCATNLWAPACITVGGESRWDVGCWRSGISVSFDICGGQIVDEWMHGSNIIRGKEDTAVVCWVYIMMGVKGRFHMSGRRFVAVGGKKRVCCDEIGAIIVSEPTNAFK